LNHNPVFAGALQTLAEQRDTHPTAQAQELANKLVVLDAFGRQGKKQSLQKKLHKMAKTRGFELKGHCSTNPFPLNSTSYQTDVNHPNAGLHPEFSFQCEIDHTIQRLL